MPLRLFCLALYTAKHHEKRLKGHVFTEHRNVKLLHFFLFLNVYYNSFIFVDVIPVCYATAHLVPELFLAVTLCFSVMNVNEQFHTHIQTTCFQIQKSVVSFKQLKTTAASV